MICSSSHYILYSMKRHDGGNLDYAWKPWQSDSTPQTTGSCPQPLLPSFVLFLFFVWSASFRRSDKTHPIVWIATTKWRRSCHCRRQQRSSQHSQLVATGHEVLTSLLALVRTTSQMSWGWLLRLSIDVPDETTTCNQTQKTLRRNIKVHLSK